MKILFFSPYFYPYTSGVTTYPLKILSHLGKKNKITVLTFLHDPKLSNQLTHNQLTHNQLTIIRMPYLFKISKGFISPQSILYFINKCKNSDLIILNHPNFEGLFLAIIAKIFRKKIISIFHCQVFLEGNLLTKIINFALNTSMIIQLRLSNKIVVYTKDYVDSLPYFKKLIDKTINTLPPIEYFSDDRKFSDKLLKLKKNKIWLGFAGRISQEKGLEYLIESLTPVGWPNGLPTGVELVFAGPYGKDVAGENIYYNKILQLLKKNKISYSFLGNLVNNQLFSFYKSIDILMLPSINQTEAFGMVQAEAMISGTPVIATNLPGVRVPIQLTKMGLVIEPKNSDQISQAISEILKNKNKFTNDKLVKNTQEIFNIKKIYKFYDNLVRHNQPNFTEAVKPMAS